MNGSSPRTGIEIEVRRNSMLETTVTVGPQYTATTVEGLLPLSTYNFSAYVVSNIGRSRPSSLLASTLSLSTTAVQLIVHI